MDKKNITEKIIKNTYKKYQILIPFEVVSHKEEKHNGVHQPYNALFQSEEGKVYFFETNLKRNYDVMQKSQPLSMDWKMYIEIHAVHEPGHLFDEKREELTNKKLDLFERIQQEEDDEKAHLLLNDFFFLTLLLENNAWRYCYEVMDETYHQAISELKTINMKGYAKSCEEIFLYLRQHKKVALVS